VVPVPDGHGESESARPHGSLRELFAFRSRLHGSLARRDDAVFELRDALLTAGWSGFPSSATPVGGAGGRPSGEARRGRQRRGCRTGQELVGCLPRESGVPFFVFDAGYDPVRLQKRLEGCPAQILVRLRSGRTLYADAQTPDARPVGRPPRHGAKFSCKEPSTWPEPTAEHSCVTGDYGAVRVRARSGLHPKTRRGALRGSDCRGGRRRLSWWRSRGCRGASGVGNLRSYGYGGSGEASRISIYSGRRTAAASTSSTSSSSSKGHSDGPRLA
jgi:hypothetical protein